MNIEKIKKKLLKLKTILNDIILTPILQRIQHRPESLRGIQSRQLHIALPERLQFDFPLLT